MFVSMVQFPEIKAGKEEDFKAWFVWANSEFSKFPGFIRRSLLEPEQDGIYAAIIEMNSKEDFLRLHASPVHTEVAQKVAPLLAGSGSARFYRIVIK